MWIAFSEGYPYHFRNQDTPSDKPNVLPLITIIYKTYTILKEMKVSKFILNKEVYQNK